MVYEILVRRFGRSCKDLYWRLSEEICGYLLGDVCFGEWGECDGDDSSFGFVCV